MLLRAPESSHKRVANRQQPGGTAPAILAILLLWLVIYLASCFSPALLDDADATHAQAAAAMLRTGDWVTLHVNGIRYLEKAPLPYWITALSLGLFGNNSFAVHLPVALTVLGLALLAWHWGRHAFGALAGFYAALFLLTSAGLFLFTRVFIPDAMLSLLLACALYGCLRALGTDGPKDWRWAMMGWVAVAAAILTKGLVAPVFVIGALALYLPLAGEFRHWRRLHPISGVPLLLAIAAPWHILAGVRNRDGADGHGFFWFYFINEHLLRFLGRRTPVDYNKLPTALYWSLHLVWLFPWSFFLPVGAVLFWRTRKQWRVSQAPHETTEARRSALLLGSFSAFVLVFFSLSTNQEYYTLPVYLPLLLLIAITLVRFEREDDRSLAATPPRRTVLISQGVLALLGLLAAAALLFELWTSRHLPAAPNIGDLFVQRGVGNYTLSMSHLFDLTSASFSALRLPAALACAAFAVGPALSLLLRARRRHIPATLALVGTGAVFLVAAHLALIRFAPMLSSADFAAEVQTLERTRSVSKDSQVLLFGDQALGSSIPFYLQRQVKLVDGRSTSMLFGSTFPDAPPIFLTHDELFLEWGKGPRKLLFVPLEHRADVDPYLQARSVTLYESAGKELLTDRPLERAVTQALDSQAPVQNNRSEP